MTVENVKNNLLRIRAKIAHYTPNIIAVTKYYSQDALVDAYNAGLRDFAESRVGDAIPKIESLPEEIKSQSRFHYIGHLQSNKVDKVVRYFDCIQSVDSLKIATKISESAKKMGKIQEVLLQVNISEEAQKFGFSVQELEESFNLIMKLENLKIAGLMCMAPFGASDDVLDSVFMRAKQIKDNLNHKFNTDLQELSMGMSNDYERAVASGATMIRLGRILFE